jgi:hypothetical protein
VSCYGDVVPMVGDVIVISIRLEGEEDVDHCIDKVIERYCVWDLCSELSWSLVLEHTDSPPDRVATLTAPRPDAARKVAAIQQRRRAASFVRKVEQRRASRPSQRVLISEQQGDGPSRSRTTRRYRQDAALRNRHPPHHGLRWPARGNPAWCAGRPSHMDVSRLLRARCDARRTETENQTAAHRRDAD